MPVVDPVSDMLCRIRNAHMALHRKVDVPASRMKEALAGILRDEGYITDYVVEGGDIKIVLKYASGRPLISGLKKISTPGRRVYVGSSEIPRVQNGLGICILSTSRGILEGESARTGNVGGEVLCEVW
ncbi:MAG: 30S ribosomal protein S8 [Thermodesulfobacteriota bacterium]|nr:30S ribosomal protein S8 [Thermodesulfobacteriota bacterium]